MKKYFRVLAFFSFSVLYLPFSYSGNNDTIILVKANSNESYQLVKQKTIDTNSLKSAKSKVQSLVTKERTLEKNKRNNSIANYGDFIEVTVLNPKIYLESNSTNTIDSLILFINNIPLVGIHPQTIAFSGDTAKLVFLFDRKSQSVGKLHPYFYTILKPIKVALSVGLNEQTPMTSNVMIELHYVGKIFMFIAIILCVLILVSVFLLAKYSNMIRTASTSSQYSLARSQLAFWTALVSCSYIYLWTLTCEAPYMPTSVLILLGVSMATKGSAYYIDYSKKKTQTAVNEIVPNSKGFIIDILSDIDGINIQRAQMVLWTLIMGIIFVYSVIVKQLMCDFDDTLLSLMGISSGTYVLLKTIETQSKPAAVVPSEVKPIVPAPTDNKAAQ